MKKSKLFLVAGGILLAASAVFATKASKKFSGPTVAYTKDGLYRVVAPSGVFTYAGPSGLTANVKLVTTTAVNPFRIAQVPLYTTSLVRTIYVK